MHEMNIAHFPWGAGVNGNTPAEYVAAFQHVVDIFTSVGASNVQFVWCVATTSRASTTPVSSYFPGDNYVSWVAMDGYNRNPAAPRSFTQIFGPDYAELGSLSNRPIMIAETASVDDPAEPTLKANWIVDSFLNEVPTDFPHIKAVLYFDSGNTKHSYPITTSPEALTAIKQIFDNSYYQATAPTATLSF
jgi:beta-mannanase